MVLGTFYLLRAQKQAALAAGTAIAPPIMTPTAVLQDNSDLTMLFGLVAAIKIAQMPGGLKVIESLGKEFIKGVFDTMHALGQASAANKVTAWANPYLVSIVLERFGFIAPEKMFEFRVGLSLASGAVIAEGFTDLIQGILPFSSSEPSEFPTQLVYSAREAGIEVPSTITWEEIAKLSEKKLLPRPKKKD